MRAATYFAVIIIGILTGCNEEKDVTRGLIDADFYPIKVGQSRIYQVNEIRYQLIGFDTSAYQLRETVFDSIVSADRVTYMLLRDRRTALSDPWVSDSLWTVTLTPNFVSVNENNIALMKLTFPVSAGRVWNGNGLNTRAWATYRYMLPDTVSIDSIALTNHMRVVISDVEQNIVNRDERSELYVKGVGLVRKDYLTLGFCTSNCDQFGQIQSGRFLRQVLIEILDD